MTPSPTTLRIAGDGRLMAGAGYALLLQVAFHARVAAEAGPDRAFDVDDVAAGLVDKLVRRHPHVFGDAGPRDVAAVNSSKVNASKARNSMARRGRQSRPDEDRSGKNERASTTTCATCLIGLEQRA